jgi:hypothetical protein
MNEIEAGHKWMSWGNEHGVMTRLENTTAASVPDIIFMSGGLMMWMELKVLYNGRYIYSPIFQLAYATKISHHIHDWQHHYIVYDPESSVYRQYLPKQIKEAPGEPSGTKQWRTDLQTVAPKFAITNKEEFKQYLDELEKQAFG